MATNLKKSWFIGAVMPLMLVAGGCKDNPYKAEAKPQTQKTMLKNSSFIVEEIQKGGFFEFLDDGAYKVTFKAAAWGGKEDLPVLLMKGKDNETYYGYAGISIIPKEYTDGVDSAAIAQTYIANHPEFEPGK